MSNLPVLPDAAPSYLAELIKNNPALAVANEVALQGISAGAPPLISTKGTWFTIKEGGTTTLINSKDGQPISILGCIILGAKGPLEKRYYASAYDPKAEPGPPDCQSFDSVKPDPASPQKQNESCAGCWANIFGSGHNAKGEPSGKACSDLKKLVLFANGKVYGFYVTPGSLKNFGTYVRDLSTRGIPYYAVITNIGFDIERPQVLTFTYAGMLDPQKQLPKVIELIGSKEVKENLEFNMPIADIAPKAAPHEAPPAAEAKPEPEKPKAVPTRKKQEPKPEPKPEPQTAAADLGLPGEDPANVVIETTADILAPAEPDPVAPSVDGPSDAEIAAALGL